MHRELYVVGAVFLKNTISNHWVEEEKQFSIHEDDKQVIRENIVQAVIAAPNVIRYLALCNFGSELLDIYENF